MGKLGLLLGPADNPLNHLPAPRWKRFAPQVDDPEPASGKVPAVHRSFDVELRREQGDRAEIAGIDVVEPV